MFNKKLSLDKIIDYLIEFNYLFLIFIVPLWFAYFFPTFHIFEFSKFTIFRFLLFTLTLFTALRFLLNSRAVFELSKLRQLRFFNLFIVPSVLILGLLITLPLSINIDKSFFGYIGRQQGVISYLFYFIWAFILALNLLSFNSVKERSKRIGRILHTLSASASLVAIYGILQIFNIDFISWPEAPYLTQRALSTLGQPNFLASFLLLSLPISFYLAKEAKKFLLKFLYFLMGSFQLIALYFTASRGAFLALLLGLFLLLIYFSLIKYWRKNKKQALILFLLGVVLIFFGVFTSNLGNKIKTSFNFNHGSAAMRVYLFQAAANAVLEKPFFGYGAENSADVFIKHYERDWGLHENVSANSDRAHNIFLDILLNHGFFGLILYTIWFYYIFHLSFKLIKKYNSNNSKPNNLPWFLMFAIFTYLASLFFSFTILSAEVYLWLYFVIILVLYLNFYEQSIVDDKQDQAINLKHSQIFNVLKVFICLVFIFISLGQIYRAWQGSQANYIEFQVRDRLSLENNLEAVYLAELIEQYKIEPNQRRSLFISFYEPISSYCINYKNSGSDISFIQEYLLGKADLLSNYNYEELLIKSKIHECLDEIDLAEEYYNKLLQIAPEWPLAYFSSASFYLRMDNIEMAEKLFQMASLNLPDENSPVINQEHRDQVLGFKFMILYNLGLYYFNHQNYLQARYYFKLAYKAKIHDYSLLKKIADTYYLESDFKSALYYLKRGAILSPTDYNWPLAMAVVEAEQGETGESLKYFYQAWRLAPQEQKDQILQAKDNVLKFN